MSLVRFLISAVFLAAGLSVILIAIIGVYRFHYIMNRMHSAASIDAVGLFLILTGLMILSGNAAYIPKLLLVLMIQWIGSPIASHMVGRLEIRTSDDLSTYMQMEDDEYPAPLETTIKPPVTENSTASTPAENGAGATPMENRAGSASSADAVPAQALSAEKEEDHGLH